MSSTHFRCRNYKFDLSPMRISWSATDILKYVYIWTDIWTYLYYMYQYTNVFVLYLPMYGCICTICTDIWMYLYCMYGYMDVFVLCVLILIRTWSFRFVYSIYFPKPPQSALKPHSNYKKDLQFARTEPFHSSPLCHAGPNARSHTKRGTTCLLCTKCK